MKSLYILLITILICTASCRAPKGDPGPAGKTGTAGAAGTAGTDELDKQGFATGKLAYVDYKDSALSLPFTYEYIESLEESRYDVYNGDGDTLYELSFTRRDISDYDKYFSLNFYDIPVVNGVFQAPTSGNFDFSYITNINNSLFEFTGNYDEGGNTQISFGDGYSSTVAFTNFKLDTLTGRLTFGYTVTYDPSDINSNFRYDDTKPATITGSVDVVVNRKKYPSQQLFTQLPTNEGGDKGL